MSIQVHLAVAARSRPLALSLTSGQEHDIPQVARLLADHQPEYVIADKACDSDEFVQQITDPRLPLRLLRSVFTGTSLIDIPDLHVVATDLLNLLGQCRHLSTFLLIRRGYQQSQQIAERVIQDHGQRLRLTLQNQPQDDPKGASSRISVE